MNARDLGELLMWIAGVIGAITLIWHKGIKPPIRFAQRVGEAMVRVEHELGNNGGGTLRDHVDGIAAETKLLAAQAETRHQAMDARLSTLEHHLLSTSEPIRSRRKTQTAVDL